MLWPISPPAWTLLAKQLVHYAGGLSPAAGLHEDPETGPTQPATPSTSSTHHTATVWHAIAAKEVAGVVAHPLATAPAYWQCFMATRGALSDITVGCLYAEARTLLHTGFQAPNTLMCASTSSIWEAMLPYLYRTGTTSLPRPPTWDDTTPSLAGIQLFRPSSPAPPGARPLLSHRSTPNWLSCNSHGHLHSLLGALAPPEHRITPGPCPWCHAVPCTWLHVLHDCKLFLLQVPPRLEPWAALVRSQGIGLALVAASTRVLLLLTFAAQSILEHMPPLTLLEEPATQTLD